MSPMMIGNGYTKHHAQLTLQLFRESQKLHDYFMVKYAGGKAR